MEKQISTGLKVTFLVHSIVGIITGLLWLLVPEWFAGTVGMTPAAQERWLPGEAHRMIGAAIVAFSASSWWAYREPFVEKVLIIVRTEIVWTVLASLVFLWGLLSGTLPANFWVNFIIMAAFAVAFMVFYPQD